MKQMPNWICRNSFTTHSTHLWRHRLSRVFKINSFWKDVTLSGNFLFLSDVSSHFERASNLPPTNWPPRYALFTSNVLNRRLQTWYQRDFIKKLKYFGPEIDYPSWSTTAGFNERVDSAPARTQLNFESTRVRIVFSIWVSRFLILCPIAESSCCLKLFVRREFSVTS